MKKTLLALTSAFVLAGAMSSTASAQSSYYNPNDRNSNGVDDRYERADDSRYADPRYARGDQSQLDYDHDGIPDVNDNDDDNDGVSDRYDSNDHDDRVSGGYAQDGRYDSRDNRDGRDDRYASRDGRYDNRDGRYDRNDRYDNRDGRHDRGRHNGWAKQRYHASRYMAPRNYTYRQYQVGSRLPMGYYGSSYYVNASPYGLQAPPRGYRWNRVGNDVYLVNTTNGIIRDVMYSLFY